MSRSKAVVFDIDGTLSPDISWLALTRDLGASVEQHIQIYTDYKKGLIDYHTSKDRLIGLWQATGNANKKFFGQLFDALPLHAAAEKIVQIAKRDRLVCLITGSMDLYAQTVAQKLSIGHWYANTTLQWDAQGTLYDMDYELQQADRKLDQFLQFCNENGLEPESCLVLGDGENDEKLFEASKHGVIIGPSAEGGTFAWKRIDRITEFEPVLLEN